MTPPRILVIAGSDSGGGAGIQADIKTITMLGGHAMTAITAITAQNTLAVSDVLPVRAEMVLKQIDMVVSDLGIDAVKIGMIGSAETAHAVADRLERLENVPIVFDPVMVASSGSSLASVPTINAFDRLLRLATVATPNTLELGELAGMAITSEADRDRAVEEVMDRTGCRALLAKGGHQPTGESSDKIRDVLYDSDHNEHCWSDPRIETPHSHGTGCTLASGIAVGLARGLPLREAISTARDYVRATLAAAPGFGKGHGPMGHALGIVPYEAIHKVLD